MNQFYVTTPIYYVNDVPHLGTAYTTVAADVLARHARLCGKQTWFLTGTDEHGMKIERAAREQGKEPLGFAAEAAARFSRMWQQLSCTYDDFIRTTETRHVHGAQELWKRVADNGALYKGAYEGWYCVRCEAYFLERELPQDKACPVHGLPLERLSEESYFFRLSSYQERLLKLYDSHPDFVLPQARMNEVKSFVRQGLEDLSVSRASFDWGIPVPGDEQHVMYVWFDALGNYWSALQQNEATQRMWPPDVHLVGKDILRFHAIYWPAFLMAAGFDESQLPRHVFAHGWMTIDGKKMSKTLRNAVTPEAILQAFEDQLDGVYEPKGARALGADVLRYYLMRAIAFGQDGDFNVSDLLQRYQSELGDSLGNLLQRVLTLCERYYDATVPQMGELNDEQRALLDELTRAANEVSQQLDAYAPHRALARLWHFIDEVNRYVERSAPWALAKTDAAAAGSCLFVVIEALQVISILLAPFMPYCADAMRKELGLDELEATLGHDQFADRKRRAEPGRRLGPKRVLFPRMDPAKASAFAAQVTAPDPR